jgi:hypothetical protein
MASVRLSTQTVMRMRMSLRWMDIDSEEDEEAKEYADDTDYVHGRRLVRRLSVKDEQTALDWCW